MTPRLSLKFGMYLCRIFVVYCLLLCVCACIYICNSLWSISSYGWTRTISLTGSHVLSRCPSSYRGVRCHPNPLFNTWKSSSVKWKLLLIDVMTQWFFLHDAKCSFCIFNRNIGMISQVTIHLIEQRSGWRSCKGKAIPILLLHWLVTRWIWLLRELWR